MSDDRISKKDLIRAYEYIAESLSTKQWKSVKEHTPDFKEVPIAKLEKMGMKDILLQFTPLLEVAWSEREATPKLIPEPIPKSIPEPSISKKDLIRAYEYVAETLSVEQWISIKGHNIGIQKVPVAKLNKMSMEEIHSQFMLLLEAGWSEWKTRPKQIPEPRLSKEDLIRAYKYVDATVSAEQWKSITGCDTAHQEIPETKLEEMGVGDIISQFTPLLEVAETALSEEQKNANKYGKLSKEDLIKAYKYVVLTLSADQRELMVKRNPDFKELPAAQLNEMSANVILPKVIQLLGVVWSKSDEAIYTEVYNHEQEVVKEKPKEPPKTKKAPETSEQAVFTKHRCSFKAEVIDGELPRGEKEDAKNKWTGQTLNSGNFVIRAIPNKPGRAIVIIAIYIGLGTDTSTKLDSKYQKAAIQHLEEWAERYNIRLSAPVEYREPQIVIVNSNKQAPILKEPEEPAKAKKPMKKKK